jgi:hypothetical protein
MHKQARWVVDSMPYATAAQRITQSHCITPSQGFALSRCFAHYAVELHNSHSTRHCSCICNSTAQQSSTILTHAACCSQRQALLQAAIQLLQHTQSNAPSQLTIQTSTLRNLPQRLQCWHNSITCQPAMLFSTAGQLLRLKRKLPSQPIHTAQIFTIANTHAA